MAKTKATSGTVAKAASTGRRQPPAERRPRRRTHAERSADTQARLIAAAISCLHRVGYSATTTTMVADDAEVSRGAMTHQFPTKVDLMLAVVRAVFDDEVREYARILGVQKDPVARLYALPAALWEVLSRPSGVAVTEIMMASRSDPALAAGLIPMQTAIEREAQAAVLAHLKEAGLPPSGDAGALQRLFVAAIRGLAIDALFTRDKREIEQSVAMLEKFLRLLTPHTKEASHG